MMIVAVKEQIRQTKEKLKTTTLPSMKCYLIAQLFNFLAEYKERIRFSVTANFLMAIIDLRTEL